MTYRIKVFILTDYVEMPEEADSYVTNSWQKSLFNTFNNFQHIFICHSHIVSFIRNKLEVGVCY